LRDDDAIPGSARLGALVDVAAPPICEIDPYDRRNGAATALYESMANGQVVLVTTEPLDGGPPVRSVYFVAEGDPAKAAAIIAAIMAPNESVEALGQLPEAAVKALGLKPGDFTPG